MASIIKNVTFDRWLKSCEIARARNMSQLAKDAGMTRAGLYKALFPDGNPSFATVAKVAKAPGLKVTIHPT